MGAVELQSQIAAIMERIDNLKSFDVTTITQRYDPKAQALSDSVNKTIADIFGRNTQAYWHHSLPSFEAAHIVLGNPKRSASELRGIYKDGIARAITQLTEIAESLKNKLDKPESLGSP